MAKNKQNNKLPEIDNTDQSENQSNEITTDKKHQMNFFEEIGVGKVWQDEWWDMPEFVQGDLKPFNSITVHFEDEIDQKEFAKLLNQKITPATKYVWYPKSNTKKPSDYRYIENENN